MAPELLGQDEDTLDSKFLGELLDRPFRLCPDSLFLAVHICPLHACKLAQAILTAVTVAGNASVDVFGYGRMLWQIITGESIQENVKRMPR